jgi:hypothetical protein
MGVKFTINGQNIECDSADDAASILLAMSGGKRRATNRPSKRGKASERPIMSPNVRELLSTLKEAHPTDVTTTDLAARLDVSAKGLPPLVTAFRNWARNARLDPDTLMNRNSVLDNKGKQVSAYSITEEGIAVFQKELSRV